MLIYKKLLKRKKLIKYWLFFNSSLRAVIGSSYKYLALISKVGCFSNFKILIISLKRLIPVFYTLSKVGGSISFIAAQYIYTKTVCKHKYIKFIKTISCNKPGIFSNFSVTSKVFKNLDFLTNPGVAVFFNYSKKDRLLEETRLKSIPTVSLVSSHLNSAFVEYPIYVNSIYFYTVYFFTHFFFKFLIYDIKKL
jgi:hypothetical protein